MIRIMIEIDDLGNIKSQTIIGEHNFGANGSAIRLLEQIKLQLLSQRFDDDTTKIQKGGLT